MVSTNLNSPLYLFSFDLTSKLWKRFTPFIHPTETGCFVIDESQHEYLRTDGNVFFWSIGVREWTEIKEFDDKSKLTKTPMRAHAIAAKLANSPGLAVSLAEDREGTAAHLCGISQCVLHTSYEPPKIMDNRKTCRKNKECNKQHEPECLIVNKDVDVALKRVSTLFDTNSLFSKFSSTITHLLTRQACNILAASDQNMVLLNERIWSYDKSLEPVSLAKFLAFLGKRYVALRNDCIDEVRVPVPPVQFRASIITQCMLLIEAQGVDFHSQKIIISDLRELIALSKTTSKYM